MLYFFLISVLSIAQAQTEPTPRVVVTLKPIHALVSGVMDGVEKPYLLLQGGESPHTYSLKPSQIRQLNEADLIVWIGPELETFLQKPLTALSTKVKQLPLGHVKDLTVLKVRAGGQWDAHEQTPADPDHHTPNDRDQEIDPHSWLDPLNAKVMVTAIAAGLSEIDAKNASRYTQNATQLTAQLNQLDQSLSRQLAPLKEKPFLVFHDAYQYFEKRYQLTAVGAVTLSPERPLSAKRLHELRMSMQAQKVHCLFSEPQFQSKLIPILLEGTSIRHGELDPLGTTLTEGTEAYFVLLQNLVHSFSECLLSK